MKKDLLTKMMIIGAAGLGGLIFTIAVIWSFSGSEKEKNPKISNQDHTIPQEIGENELAFQADSLNGEKTLALIRKPLTADSILPVYDLETQKDILLKIKGSTVIKSEYGEQIAISQIRPGQIIEGKYDKSNFDAFSIQISGRAWEKRNPSALIISTEQNKIKIGTDEYSFDPGILMTFKGGKTITPAEVSGSDELILRGYKNMVWSIEVVAGHGFLVLKNSDAFLGGTIEIGNRDIRTIDKDMRIEVSAGVKKVIITQENMNPYSNDVFIEEGKEVVIDLGEFKPKVGKVTFTTVQEGVTLYINEEKQAVANGEVTLDFGKYKLKAEKEGYTPWESSLTVNQVVMQVTIDMKMEPQHLEVQTPIGAELYIDGARVGIIPARTAITPGEHNITIRKEGYYSKNQTITVENNGKNVNYAFPDLIRIGSNESEQPNSGISPSAPNVTNPPANSNIKLNPTEDNY
ncbi:PEGA domain-containing protein [Clostridiales bacterium COT073_COT-073]|nr:PEGA domain-containing protein [Clostridiales bacterium COT073_COT-073]